MDAASNDGGAGMKQVAGVWLPAAEEHLIRYLEGRTKHARMIDGRGTYQVHKLEAALPWVKDWRTAIDVGAHVGLWAMHLAPRFARLHCFEPMAAHRACLTRNMAGRDNVEIHGVALGAAYGQVAMRSATVGSSGDTQVAVDADDWAKAEIVPLRRLDSFALADVDFIKIDCEGYELFVLQGGEDLLDRCRPAIVVEQKPGKAEAYGLGRTDAVGFLEGLGAKLRAEIAGDYILSWD